MFSKISNFLGEVKGELRKASWPWESDPKIKGLKKYKELVDSTIVVLIAMVLLAGFVQFWDFFHVLIVGVLTILSTIYSPISAANSLVPPSQSISDRPVMSETKPFRDQWYVVQVLSGQEGKVRDRIARTAEAEGMTEYIREVLVPAEMVSEIRRGKKTETKKKFFPGYIIVNMNLATEDNQLVEKTWFFIKEMDGVIGFAGTKDRPAPMRPREVEAMLSQIKEREESVRPAISFEVGDTVKVADGPFQSQNGIVEEIDPERGKLRVSVTIFGRSTPVELEYWQVERE